MRSWLVIAVKVAISSGVIFTISRRFEVSQLLSSLRNVNLFYLVIATALAFLTVPVVGTRWRLLAEMLSVKLSTAVATRATFAGLFVGQLLPGAIGADVVRGWMVWNMGLRNKLVIASIVADRLTSLFAVVIMISASSPMLIPYLPHTIGVLVGWSSFCIIIMLLFSIIASNLLLSTGVLSILNRILAKHRLDGINVSSRAVFASVGLAVFGHSLMILSAYFLSLAIGIDSSLWMWWLVMPIIILVTAIPISINGWGVREFAMIHLWALFGIAESGAFLISICLGIVAIASSLPGLWFWLEKRGRVDIGTVYVTDPTPLKVSPCNQ
jgi:uncharacterized membrane protein YbhN (UPF0104 family)